MKTSIRKGFGFGITSGIITTLGIIVGLNSSTHNSNIIIGGIIVIAIADALSDALAMHVSEESALKNTVKQIWESTISTFFTKFIVALTFIIPVWIFLPDLTTAIIASVIWGLLLLGIFSYKLAIQQKIKPYKAIIEHIGIAIVVILITHFVGSLIETVI